MNYNYKNFEEILKLTINILNNNNIRYYLDAGTLLGIIRNNYFIEGDDDIDIGIFADEIKFWQMDNLKNDLIKAGFFIRRNQKNVLILNHPSNCQIELWLNQYDKTNKYYYHSGWKGIFIFPDIYLNNLISIKFLDQNFYIPNQPEAYLENLYGKEWNIPRTINKPYDYPCYKEKEISHQEFLFPLLDLLEQNGIPYFLFCGTLLGAVRDNSFLPGDEKDTDIAVDDKYYWKIREILNHYMQKNPIYYKYIWRKEISIGQYCQKYKLDIFFLEKSNDTYFCYSYKPNPIDKVWNQEWRTKFNYSLFYPLRHIKFLGHMVNVPNNYLEVLSSHYGLDWNTPNPNHKAGDKEDIDLNYKEFYPAGINGKKYIIPQQEYNIGYICINFLRPYETKECILSLQRHAPNVKIYIADQDEPSGEMIEFYETHNIEYYFVPHDIGLSWCRNFLVEKVKEPYLMWGDNDFIFTENHNMKNAITILDNYSDIGFVGGAVIRNGIIGHYERILSYIPKYNTLIYLPLELSDVQPQYIQNVEFYPCDLTYNYVICKTQILHNNPKLRWNEHLKCKFEHSDMFLRINQYNNYQVVYCPSMTVIHAHVSGNQEYNSYRLRNDAGIIFANDWNLKSNFTIGKGKELYHTGEIIKSANFQVKKSVVIPDPVSHELHNSCTDLLKILKLNNINFWLTKTSCLECVKYKELKTTPLSIGVRTKNEVDIIYKLIPTHAHNQINIEINSSISTKQASVKNILVMIPYPVIDYLIQNFGEKWNKI